MQDRCELVTFALYGWHKGFYNDEDFSDALMDVEYKDFLNIPTMMMNFHMIQHMTY